MRISVTVTIFSIVSLIFLSCSGNVFALEENVGVAQIDSSSPIYFLKTIREGIELKFATTTKTKLIRQLEFATRRLREAKSLAGGKNEELIQAAMERYWSSLTQVLSYEAKDEELTILSSHVSAIHLKELMALYSKLSNTKAKLGVRSIIHRLLQDSEIKGGLKDSGCNFLLSESSSSALTQSEQVIYKERALKCFGKGVIR